jgi:N-acetylglucosaminyl-diphospho-decaprenol L-rhamnosyltransferase
MDPTTVTSRGGPRSDAVSAPDVMTVIVVHNSTESLPGCLRALGAAAAHLDARVTVVDSGSSDDPGSLCAQHGVPILRVPNRGLGAAFNRALGCEEVRRARYVLQLNPDVELPAGGLDELVARADHLPRCGVRAPRQHDQNGELIFSIGVEPSAAPYWRSIAHFGADWIWERDRYGAECQADWLMGACMLLRREMLAEIGGFDERFFLSSEEVDLCRRAREAGWSVNYTPAVTVTHPLADRQLAAHRVRLEEWSRILYIRKWYGWRTRCSMRLALVTRFALLSALEARHRDPRLRSRVRLGATLRFRRREYLTAPGER